MLDGGGGRGTSHRFVLLGWQLGLITGILGPMESPTGGTIARDRDQEGRVSKN